MPAETCIMGLFKDDGTAAKVILDLEASGFAVSAAPTARSPATGSWRP